MDAYIWLFGHAQMVPPSSRTRLCALLVCIDWAEIILQIGVRNHAGLECSHSTELDKNAIRHSDPKCSSYEKEKTERGVTRDPFSSSCQDWMCSALSENCNPEVVQLVQ